MSDNKWVMFKNYMHNELGITREDIRQWIKESVEDEARRLVDKEFGYFDIKSVIDKFVWSNDYWNGPRLREDIKKDLIEKIMKKIDINVKG